MPTITIPDDTYQRLQLKAARLHISVEHVIAPALQQVADDELGAPLSGDAWRAELEAWRQEATSRDSRYPTDHVLDVSREAM